MSEQDFDWKEFHRQKKIDRQARHAEWKKQGTAAIAASGIAYRSANNGESLIFREPGMPRVDYFPSTGRAVIDGRPARSFGHVSNFLRWYNGEANKVMKRT